MSKVKFLKEDKKAKSKSFFLTKESKTFDSDYIRFLENFFNKENSHERHLKKNC